MGANSIPVASLDFTMSLGLLHHISDATLAIKDVARSIKPGDIFFVTFITTLKINRLITNSFLKV